MIKNSHLKFLMVLILLIPIFSLSNYINVSANSVENKTSDSIASDSIDRVLNVNTRLASENVPLLNRDIRAMSGNIPAPPQSGPSVIGNFKINGNTPVQELQYPNMQVIADGSTNTVESMWYKNNIDLARPFQTEFYVYMDGIADGITFTLQSQGQNATGVNGESLGAYGNVRKYPYNNYIKNAFSLEFDPYFNGDYSDSGLTILHPNSNNPGAHVAFVYPNKTTGGYGVYSMNHYDVKYFDGAGNNGTFNDAKWHKVTYTWTPKGADGKVASSKNKPVTADAAATVSGTDSSGQEKTYNIGTQIVNLKDTFGKIDSSEKLLGYWGFTGSTGAKSMKGAVAYTKVIQQAGLKNEVRNITAGQKDFSEKIDAKKGDILEYRLIATNDRLNGLGNAWDNVKIVDDLPDGILAQDANGEFTNKSYSASLGTVNVDDVKTLTFRAKVIKNEDKDISLTTTAIATGSNYYQSPSNLSSNQAVVNVKKQDNLSILSLNNTIYDKTFDDSHNDENTEIYNVVKGDVFEYKSVITNTVENAQYNNGKYTISFPSGTDISSVDLGLHGKTGDSDFLIDDYQLELGSGYTISNSNGLVTITIESPIGIPGPVSGNETIPYLTIDISGKIGDIEGQDSYSTAPTISGIDMDGSNASDFSGNNVLVKYSKNSLVINPLDISFGAHIFSNGEDIFKRTPETTSPNPAVKFEDNRRDKRGIKVLVSQNDNFRNDKDLSQTLDAQIRYYNGKEYQTIFNNPTEVYQTNDGEIAKNIVWSENNGLMLYERKKNSHPGKYTTTLTWNVVDGI